MIKKLSALITVITMLSASVVFAENIADANASTDISIMVNSEKLVPKDINGKVVNPFLLDGTTYLPVRAVSEALGEKVSWDGDKRIVFIGEVTQAEFEATEIIRIVVSGNLIEPKDVNGKVVNPILIDGTTYVPIRAVTEALGKEIYWDGETRTVYIGEMPPVNREFAVDISSFNEFSETTLFTVNSIPVKGSFMNLYILSYSDEDLSVIADNYSPDKNLQTLTVDSVPVAKYLTDQISNSLTFLFSIYNDAKKAGFTNETSTTEAIEKEWKLFRSQFATDEGYQAYLTDNAISNADLKKLIEINTVFNLYGNSIYESNKQKDYDTSAYEAVLKQNYITAKHILVEDEQLAKDIIAKIEKGENFDMLMKEHNTDPGATEEGYTFTYGQMVEPFEKAAFALEENSYTKEPVKTQFGYHIIYRCPLSDKAVADYLSAYTEAFASSATNDYLEQIYGNAAVTYAPDYEKYITTIK